MLLTSCKCRSYLWWVIVFLSCKKYGEILTDDRNLLSLLFSRSYGCSANEIFRLAQRKFFHENITWTIVACAAFVIFMFHLISCGVNWRWVFSVNDVFLAGRLLSLPLDYPAASVHQILENQTKFWCILAENLAKTFQLGRVVQASCGNVIQ